MATGKEISAGGIVYRKVGNQAQIQLIRDKHGKMTFAKGRIETGESISQTVLREIEEETGIIGEIVRPLSTIVYDYEHPERGLIQKEVHYFLVEAVGGELKAQNEEINSVDWFEAQDAWEQQEQSGYANNRDILRTALKHLGC